MSCPAVECKSTCFKSIFLRFLDGDDRHVFLCPRGKIANPLAGVHVRVRQSSDRLASPPVALFLQLTWHRVYRPIVHLPYLTQTSVMGRAFISAQASRHVTVYECVTGTHRTISSRHSSMTSQIASTFRSPLIQPLQRICGFQTLLRQQPRRYFCS